MGYVVKEEGSQTGEVTRRGPFVTEQEARMVLANAVRDGRKDCHDAKGNLVSVFRGTSPGCGGL